MQQYLITTLEVSSLSRSMSVHIDEDKIETYIRESESIDIKSALGDALYLDVKDNPDKYKLLLDTYNYGLFTIFYSINSSKNKYTSRKMCLLKF